MTTPTTAGGAELPITDWRDGAEYWSAVDDDATKGAIALTLHAPAQAEIDALRAENERLTRESSDWQYSAMHNLRRRLSALGERNTARAENERLKSEMQERALQALCDDGQWMEETGRLHAELERKSEAIQRLWRERDALKAALNPPANTPPTGVFVQAAQDDQARDAGRLDWIERKVCDVSRLGDSARTVRISWNNGADYVFIGPGYNATWRAAIDSAIAATKETP